MQKLWHSKVSTLRILIGTYMCDSRREGVNAKSQSVSEKAVEVVVLSQFLGRDSLIKVVMRQESLVTQDLIHL